MESLHSELPPGLKPRGLMEINGESLRGCSPKIGWHPRLWASLIAQWVKNLPAMQETVVLSVGQEDPLEKEMATLTVFLCQLQIGTRALPTTEQLRHLHVPLHRLNPMLL